VTPPTDISVALAAIVAFAGGFAAAWLLRRAELLRELGAAERRLGDLSNECDAALSRTDDLQARVTAVTADLAAARASLKQIDSLRDERDTARRDLDAERKALGQLRTDYATLQTQTDEKLKAADEKLQILREAGDQLKKDFENLANRIFEEKREKFTQSNRESIEGLLKPVKDQLIDFKSKVEEVYINDVRDRTSLKTEIDNLQKASERAGNQAESLARALTGDSRVRGNWGEISLERILEDSGLRKGHEYDVQVSHQNEEGQRLRPDMIVRLPERKAVIIDSKVSLVAYEHYHAAQSDEERQQYLREHVASIRTHIKGLSAKNYQDLIGVNSLDLVLMYIPIEPSYLLALEHDASLYTDAFNRKILLVSPTTLMGTLQIIHNIWRYERQNRHALEIAERAAGLHDQLVLFSESLTEIGERLGQAQSAYETTRKRLTGGKGNLVSRAENLRALGIKARKTFNAALVAEAGEAADETALEALEEPQIDEENANDHR
jgi:DNA recombination protein RmuC